MSSRRKYQVVKSFDSIRVSGKGGSQIGRRQLQTRFATRREESESWSITSYCGSGELECYEARMSSYSAGSFRN